MVKHTTTRRRVVQGAGAIGVASFAGGAAVTAQEDGEDGEGGGGEGGAAVRVAHASPDAPNVDVRLDASGSGDGAGTPNGDGTETPDGGGEGGGDGASAEIEGVGFRDVSGYTEIDPGTYRAQVVVTGEEGLLEGILDDFLGGDDGGDGEDGETVVFDEEIDVEEGTTYTLVAFGELSQGPASETGGGGEDGENGEGTDEDSGSGGGEQGASGQGFQVQVLEDDISDPGEDSSRVRIFHAVPDVEAVSIATTGGGSGEGTATPEDGGEGGDGTETPEDDGALGDGTETPGADGAGGEGGETLVEELSYGESESVELAPGDYTLRISAAGGTGTDGGLTDGETEEGTETETESDGIGGDAGQEGESDAREAELSTEGSTTYSAFALGYFDPQAAGTGGAADGNESDGGLGGEDGGDGGDGDGTETPENGTDAGGDGSGEEFELVTVEDSQGGERSDGGTDGLL